MNLSAWSGWHWVLVGLGAALAAEKALESDPALGPAMNVLVYVTTVAMTLVGLLSPSAVAAKVADK
jgi:hypothetical protein